MAAITPSVLFPGYALLAAAEAAPSQGIFIPLADLVGLTAAEGDVATGDGRKVAYEVLRRIESSFSALPTTDRPTRMNVAVGTPTGINGNTVRRSYTLTFDVSISDTDMADEA
ncbi:MAG: hypothetical protein KME20_13250 [Kaiparowitsia implicata GSE-PSE-MK54-09C]|jgi:hypothetical protein|nr:hypothetical protein [Kaiparowitsia implicata GSE-PSE-MK54-09C]